MLSIIVFTGLLVYFLVQLKSIVEKQQFTVLNAIDKRDLEFDNTSISMTKDNFDIAIRAIYLGKEKKIEDDIDLYFSYYFENIIYSEIEDIEIIEELGVAAIEIGTKIPLGPCTKDRFMGNSEGMQILGILEYYLCP